MIITLVFLFVVSPVYFLVILLNIRSGGEKYSYVMGILGGLVVAQFIYQQAYRAVEDSECERAIPHGAELTTITPLPRLWSLPGHRGLLCHYNEPSGTTGVVLIRSVTVLPVGGEP